MKKARLLLLALPLVAGTFYLRALASWRPKLVLEVPPTRSREAVKALAFSGDRKRLAVAMAGTGENEPWARVHSVTSLDAEAGFAEQWQWGPSPSYPEGYKDGRFLSFLQQDSAILMDGDLQLWDASTGKVLMEMPLLPNGCATLSPDKKWLASLRYSGDYSNRKTDVVIARTDFQQQGTPSMSHFKSFAMPPSAFQSKHFCFSPDGASFVLPVGDERSAHLNIYDTTNWKLTKSLTDWKSSASQKQDDPKRDNSGYFLAKWSRNGCFLMSGWLTARGLVGMSLWRVSDGRRLSAIKPNVFPPNCEVQNDGSLIAWGNSANIYRSQGASFILQSKPLFTLPDQDITAATISPDGATLAVGTAKGAYTVRLK